MTGLQLSMPKKKRSPESLQLNSTYAKYTTLSVQGAKASELSGIGKSTVFNQFSKNWRKYNPTLTEEEFKTLTSNWFRRAGTRLNRIKKSANQIEKEPNDPQIDNFI
ncbi:hypothetical protein RN001_012168 [Aquatica leii]|uniref:Uncharacterized protein n=1 Tax=Aquatica leii TaxID=1421715 RepID=A0AAN7S7N6_9COLE|nr:hypothetical protein RN001_012168 [Aquatica leii]